MGGGAGMVFGTGIGGGWSVVAIFDIKIESGYLFGGQSNEGMGVRDGRLEMEGATSDWEFWGYKSEGLME